VLEDDEITLDRRRIEEFLLERGADRLAHPGGTLFDHLRRVAALLRDWGADPKVQAAGLCHACYGTDGFPTALLEVDDRARLANLIGARAESLVYLYGSCDRSAVYPRLTDPGTVPFRDRFSGLTVAPAEQDVRDFCELTAANELDVVAHNAAIAAKHGAGLFQLFASIRGRLSAAAWRACMESLGGDGRRDDPA
jgi:hypothetical protein